MYDPSKINQDLLQEIAVLKQTIRELEQSKSERKQAEKALHASEENFRRSLDDSPLGIRIVTAEGETIYANRAILDMYGYDSVDDLISTPVKKHYTPESYAEFKIRREKRKRGDYGPSEYEISIIRRDGEIRYLRVFRKEVLWGGQRQFQAIYQDITDRKRTEETLRLVTDNMSDMIRVTDLQGVNLYLSPSHFTVLGYRPEERVGKTGFDIVHPDDVEHLTKVFFEGLVNKKPGKVEYRIKHAEGHYVWLETIADGIMDDQGEVTAVIMSSRDITKRKQTEEEIRQSNMLLNAIIENIPNTIFLKDAKELRFVLLNRAGEDLTGYSMDDLLGKNDYDFLPKEQADFFTEKDRDVLRGKDVVDIPEEHLQTRNKVERILHTKKVPILNANGEPEYLLGISEDITDRKRMEADKEKLDARNRQLQKADSLGRMAGAIAHHFNNQLGVVIGPLTICRKVRDPSIA
jgi:PAS domain S-box-containing protein